MKTLKPVARQTLRVPNTWLGRLFLLWLKLYLNPDYRLKLRGRTPVFRGAKRHWNDLPIKDARYLGVYFDVKPAAERRERDWKAYRERMDAVRIKQASVAMRYQPVALNGANLNGNLNDTLKITKCVIDEPMDHAPNTVHAIFADGTTKPLFSYFRDELHFGSHEFIGLTEAQARELHGVKDRGYLKS